MKKWMGLGMILLPGALVIPSARGGVVYGFLFNNISGVAPFMSMGEVRDAATMDAERKGSVIPEIAFVSNAPRNLGLAADFPLGNPSGGPVLVLPESRNRFRLDQKGQAMTIVTWLYLRHEKKTRDRVIVSKRGKEGLWFLFVKDGHLKFSFTPASLPRARRGQSTVERLPTGRWIHVAAVVETSGAGRGHGIRFYVDGHPFAARGDAAVPMAASSAPIVIGGYDTGNGGALNGILSKLEIYNNTLDARDVTDLAAEGQSASRPSEEPPTRSATRPSAAPEDADTP